jgi:hypothetical protein
MATQAREQGRYLGGRPPYGYRLADARPHPNKARAASGRRAYRLEPDPCPLRAALEAVMLTNVHADHTGFAPRSAGQPAGPCVWVRRAQAAVASSRAMPAAQSSISGQSRKSPSGRAARAAGSLRSDRSAKVSLVGSSAPKKTW